MYIEKFTIRWADVDANRHLGNSAYMNFASETRMRFLKKYGFTLSELLKKNLGAVVLEEKFVYFKEFLPEEKVWVSLEIISLSEDFSMFKIQHSFYDQEGNQRAYSIMVGAWVDLLNRKITQPFNEVINAFTENLSNENYDKLILQEYKNQSIPPQKLQDKTLLK